MPSEQSREARQHTLSVCLQCDLCHSRKVRCDRQDPCGNCQDAGVSCCRGRDVKRQHTTTRRQRRKTPVSRLQAIPDEVFEAELTTSENQSQAEMPSVACSISCADTAEIHSPVAGVTYDPIHDAQLTIQRQLRHLQNLTLDRRRVLESALNVIGLLSGNSRDLVQGTQSIANVESTSKYPSLEFLTWMLKDIHSDRFGPFVTDYFRHLSLPKLKQMGLSLLRGESSPLDTIIYTICVNAAAYKFLTTTINLETDTDLAFELRRNAEEYRSAAQAALKQIPLLISPSLSLLQAILCGVFLHQGSGDVNTSGNLTKAACKTCIDLDLHTTALKGEATEEELFCFLWCYTLDRNHAFKVRSSRCLLDLRLPSNFYELYSHYPLISELLLVYLDLARVQDAVVSYPNRSLTVSQPINPLLTGESMLRTMQSIQARMHLMASSSPNWRGLDCQTEMSALKFAYQSIMTAILYLVQADHGLPLRSSESYLHSARQELLALVSMCYTAEKQAAVSFLNWTILLYPATAYLVLFCNVVATSDIGDFNLMKAIADCLTQSGISYPLVQLRNLFQKFLGLSQEFFGEDRTALQNTRPDRPADNPVAFPVGSPFSLPWGTSDPVFNPYMFTAGESYTDMLGMSESDFFLPYGGSDF
ncbi:uncharacterized protein N7511_008338 [Penicillium nucicola]|uniref:uncharacterized protein n=1 Tax=Penicillium nucicola TaxID=1850975 RepID=UPI002545A467|nr:uncharacterized protein N7511_008338 [Penicillium nucicola]KAJ5754185.1 hypothetical protein N7511_008338 [Penicillium nucicola]